LENKSKLKVSQIAVIIGDISCWSWTSALSLHRCTRNHSGLIHTPRCVFMTALITSAFNYKSASGLAPNHLTGELMSIFIMWLPLLHYLWGDCGPRGWLVHSQPQGTARCTCFPDVCYSICV